MASRRNRRRGSSAVIDFMQDITDDIKDFLDDEIIDRGRDTERDLRRAGRNWYDDDDDDDRRGSRGRRSSGTSDSDLEELRDAIKFLSRQVDARSRERVEEEPLPGYDEMNVEEINGRLPSLSQDDLARVGSYEKAHDGRTTVLDRVESLQQDEPWAGYDEQTVAQIRKKLGASSTDDETIRTVRDYERRHKGRQGVLDATD